MRVRVPGRVRWAAWMMMMKGEMGSLDGQPGMILELRLGEVPPADPLGR